MKYQIDQSGKIEQTNHVTVLACVNSDTRTVLIPAKTKRQFKEAFRKCGMTRYFIISLFTVGVYFLIKELKIGSSIIIDIEYPGKDKPILSLLKHLMGESKGLKHNIYFKRIGSKPKVHYAAHDVFVNKTRPDKVLSLKDLLEVIKKTDGRLRECLSTLVDAQARPLTRIYHRRVAKSRNFKKKNWYN